MKCTEVHQRLVDAVDRHLSADLQSELLGHLERCRPCLLEYELQVLAKHLVRSKVPRSVTPPHVHSLIVSAIEHNAQSEPPAWYQKIIRGRFSAPALAASIALVLFTLILMLPTSLTTDDFSHTSANDVINRSVQNFSLVRSGELKPSMIACYPDILVGYFEQQGMDFAVSVLADDSCDWYGAVSDSYDGVKQAHIVYKRGDDILYVYEVNKDNALLGSVFSLPVAAKKSLAETGWYTDPQHKDCNVVLWTVNETLCAAVSTMSKDRMLALLASK